VHAPRVGVDTELFFQSVRFMGRKVKFVRQSLCREVELFLEVYLADRRMASLDTSAQFEENGN
jgi:hypothetical protein